MMAHQKGDGDEGEDDDDEEDDDYDIYIMMQFCSRKMITSSWESPVTT